MSSRRPSRRRRASSVVALSLLAVVLAACAADDDDAATTSASSSQPDAELTGTSWVLTALQLPAGTTADAVQGAAASLSFRAAGALRGTTGCNDISGTYTATATDLAIEVGPTTMRACPDAAATAQERAVLAALSDTKRYVMGDSSLQLHDSAGTTLLTYRAGTADLAGSSWRVSAVNNGRGAMATSALTEKLTAAFGSDATFTGFGGCNTLSGPYATSGRDGVTIGPLMSTQKSCGADVDQLEHEYGAALANVARWEVNGDVLTLRDPGGAAQVTASAAKR